MAANLTLLNADKSSTFTTHSYGNIVAGNISPELLLFVSSDGTETADTSKFGISAIGGNDGNTYSEISLGAEFDASGSALNGTITPGVGSIPDSPAIQYKISVRGLGNHESEMDSVIYSPTLTPGQVHKVDLSWTAVTGAVDYGVYISKDGGTSYKLIAYTANTSYEDLDSVATATDPQLAGAKAYRASTWGTADLSLGNLTAGTKVPVVLRENVPGGASAVGNPRQHNLFVSFLTI